MRLGEILLKRELVTAAAISEALERQKTDGGRLGANLIALGYLTEEQLSSVIHGAPAAQSVVEVHECRGLRNGPRSRQPHQAAAPRGPAVVRRGDPAKARAGHRRFEQPWLVRPFRAHRDGPQCCQGSLRPKPLSRPCSRVPPRLYGADRSTADR